VKTVFMIDHQLNRYSQTCLNSHLKRSSTCCKQPV